MLSDNNGGTGFQPVEEFKIYRRNLPHWENPGSVYFITFRTAKNFLLPELTRDVVKETCLFHADKKYDILKRRGQVWLDESFDRIVRDENELQEKLNYIINNPLKNELVEKIEDYKWLYVKGWLDKDTGKMPVPL